MMAAVLTLLVTVVDRTLIVDTVASTLSCTVISFTDCRAASSFSLALARRWNLAALTYVLGLLNACAAAKQHMV